jgi:hypothetical protein
MAQERTWNAVPPVLLTVDGTAHGVLQIVDTAGFYFGMQATLVNNLNNRLTVYIKRVVDSTTLWVGPNKGGIDHNIDLSAYTVASSSNISADQQNKSAVPDESRKLATYETDPINAWRSIPVDQYGNHYSSTNPIPVDADITVNSVQLFTLPYDSIAASYPNSTTEIYQTYLGGLSGTLQQTATVIYTDATKNKLVSVVRT